MDPIGRPRFFVMAAVDPTGRPRFLAIGLGGMNRFAIGRAVSTESDVAVGFSELFLW